MQAFQTVGEGDEVLCLSPTSKMSGAYNTACSARELLKDQGFTTPITVYDSLQVSFGLAVLAREAGRMAKAGLSAAQIVDRLDQLRPKVGVYFVMESLENARRGGRAGAIRVLAADLLKVKPILTFRDGLVRDIGIVRGYANAVERVISLYQSKAQYGGEVFLFHADREELAQQVILLAVFTLGLAGYVVYKNCRTGKVPMRQFTPMFFGVGVMFVGTVSAALPQMVSIPVDTFSCTINAICLYYMLYQRRVVQLRGFTNNAPIYVVSLVVSILLFLNVYDEIHGLYLRYFGDYRPYETIVMAAMLTVTTLVLHRLFYRLMENLLLKGTELQEQNLREFSTAVNKILQLDELLALYCDFLQQNFPGQTARVFLLNRKTGSYCMKGATDMSIANRDSFAGDHPMITWLKEHIEIIRQAGLLHDIGKIGTPEAILSKTTRLTQEEYEIMKQHVEASISMIKYLPSLDYVIPSVLGHHERWDGGGYPRGLSGNAIPIGARCLCLADSFDAMISKRSYKEAMSVEEAIGEIRRNQGTQFDPELAVLFIQLIESGKIQIHNDGY